MASTSFSSACVTPRTRGVAFGKQISELEKRAGEIPVAIVRTTDFPKSGKAFAQVAGDAEDGTGERWWSPTLTGGACWRSRRSVSDTRRTPTSPRGRRPPGHSAELDSLQKILRVECVAQVPPAPVAPPPSLVPRTTRSDSAPHLPGGYGSGERSEHWSRRSRLYAELDAGPGDFRAERVRPTCGVPRRFGQR